MELSISSYTPVNTVLNYCFSLFFVCFLITSWWVVNFLSLLLLSLATSNNLHAETKLSCLTSVHLTRLMQKFQDVKRVLLHSETYLSIHSLWFLQNLLYFRFFYFTKWLAVTMDLTAATATWLIGLMSTNARSDNTRWFPVMMRRWAKKRCTPPSYGKLPAWQKMIKQVA